MTNKTKQATTTTATPSVFDPAKVELKDQLPKEQVRLVQAWVAANPQATIVATAIAEGSLPAYLRSDTGKRADICRMLPEGMQVVKFIKAARPYGGGYTDLVAALVGGYSTSAVGYGNPVVRLEV
jgi:hypothetical protein|tara:strand:+ start:1608 stop:1982 length:375 start_codon:yes stop_codon:yes gene_type:complete